MKSFISSLFLHACIACSIVFYSSFSFLSNDIEGGKAGGSEGNAMVEILATNISLTYLNNSSLNSNSIKNDENFIKNILSQKEENILEIAKKEKKKEEIALKKEKKATQNKSIEKKLSQDTNKKDSSQNTSTHSAQSNSRQAVKKGSGGKGIGTGEGIGAGDALKDVPLGSGTGSGNYLSKIKSLKKPAYPELSRQAGEEGKTEIRVEVVEGKLVKSEIYASSSFKRLDKAALKAVKKAKFNNFTGSLIIPIIFDLKK